MVLPKFDPESRKRIKIGKNVNIGLGTVIGKIGFGYDENLLLKEHDFGVVIGDDVDIGSNCNIDIGRWRNTEIGNGTKIDSLVHIGHNVKIGKNCIIGPHVTLCGSCEIGDNSLVWSNSVINQGAHIAKNCIIGACSYLRHNTGENETWFGVPAVKIK